MEDPPEFPKCKMFFSKLWESMFLEFSEFYFTSNLKIFVKNFPHDTVHGLLVFLDGNVLFTTNQTFTLMFGLFRMPG